MNFWLFLRYNLLLFVELMVAFPPIPHLPLTSLIVMTCNREVKPESLLAYELGFRYDQSKSPALDISPQF